MLLGFETLRGKMIERSGTALHFKSTLTAPAKEMVMMFFSGQLVTIRLARHRHGTESTAFNKGLYVAVDGGDPQVGQRRAGPLMNFLRAERTGRAAKYFDD